MDSQNAWVISQLREKGFVTRNEALKNNITRLAARILDVRKLMKEWKIEAKRVGKDYMYSRIEK